MNDDRTMKVKYFHSVDEMKLLVPKPLQSIHAQSCDVSLLLQFTFLNKMCTAP